MHSAIATPCKRIKHRAVGKQAIPHFSLSAGGQGQLVVRAAARHTPWRGKSESLAFKAWYPNDRTLRVTGRVIVDGTTAEMNLLSALREVAVRF
jgi:hypothetical protein